MKGMLLIFSLLILSACSSVNIKPIAKVSDEESGEIRIYRPNTFLMKLLPAVVSVDSVDVVELNRENSVSIKLNSGSHKLTVRGGGMDGNSGCDYDINVKAKDVNYFELAPSSGSGAVAVIPIANFFVCKFELNEVDATQAESIYDSFMKKSVSYF